MSDLSNTPFKALSAYTQQIICWMLNPLKFVPSSTGHPRDWRGLAQVCMIEHAVLNCYQDPCQEVLNIIQTSLKELTIEKLLEFFKRIERIDVINEIEPHIAKDLEVYSKRLEPSNSIENDQLPRDILTIDDQLRLERGLDKQKYDAFLLYAEEDLNFAMEMLQNLEGNSLKLCIKDRDLIAGVDSEHEAIMRLISERCQRLIVIISPEFLKSPHNKFFLNYAQALGIDKNHERKIIPCMYKNCALPPQISYMSKLYYKSSNPQFFWDKLMISVKTLPAIKVKESESPRNSIPEITEIPEPVEIKLETQQPEQKQTKQSKFRIPFLFWKKSNKETSSSTGDTSLDLPTLEGLEQLDFSEKKRKKNKFLKKFTEKTAA